MALIDWPLFEDKDKAPDITDATSVLDYLYSSAYLEVFDHTSAVQQYLGYIWTPLATNVVYLGSDFAPLTNTGSVKFTNNTDGSFFTVNAKATGAYLDANFDAESDYVGKGSTSFTINFTGKNNANKVKLISTETVNNSFDYRLGYKEDTSHSITVFKDGLDTKIKTDDIVSKVASSKYDLSSEKDTPSQIKVVEKHVDTLDALYSTSAGTNQETYQILKISNEYSHIEKENGSGSSSLSEFKKETFSSEDKDISSKLSQSKDVSYVYSLNESTGVDGDVVSSESEDKSFKITYADQFVTNASLYHVESTSSKVNENNGVQIGKVSGRFNLDYFDADALKVSIALLEKSDEVAHESGNSDSTVKVVDLSRFNYSDNVNSFAFRFKEVNSSGTTANGDYKDDVYKLNVELDLKTADYSITSKEITQQTLEDFTYQEENRLYAAIAKVTDYIDQLKNVEQLADIEGNGSLFADIASVKFTDFEEEFQYASLLSDNTVKVLNQQGGRVFSGRGDDTVIGNIGADILHGETGNDILSGGGGADLFVFDTVLDSKNNVDILKDFSRIQGDKIVLDELVFTGSQEFNIARLASAAAISSNATAGVIYDNVAGKLYYNADGVAGHTTAFATLNGHPTLAANDIDFSVGAVL